MFMLQFRKVDQTSTNTYCMVAFNKFFWVYIFAARKKWCDLSGWKIDLTSIIRTRIKSEEIKLSCQKFFYCYDISKTKKFFSCFIYPWGFFSYNTLFNFGTNPHTACPNRGIKNSSTRLRYRTKLLMRLMIQSGLANLQIYLQINVFLQTSRVSTMK